MCKRTVGRWIDVARARMQKMSGVPRVEHKARVGAAFREISKQLASIANEESATRTEKINALRAIEKTVTDEAKLYGLNEPEEVRITGADPISEIFGSDEQLQQQLDLERRRLFDSIDGGTPTIVDVPDGIRPPSPGPSNGNGNGTASGSSA